MIEQLAHKERKARQPHKCDYCCGAIEKGEIYDWSKYVLDGNIYEWRSHLKCEKIVSEIWDYADPDEGMTEDLFHDTCQQVCRAFVCPDCEEWNEEYEDCEKDETYCIDAMYDFFQTHELYMSKRDGWAHIWKAREKHERKNS